MPQLKILRGAEHITINTDQEIKTTDLTLSTFLVALAAMRETIVGISDLSIERINPNAIFDYRHESNNGESRSYWQHWFFDQPTTTVSYDTAIGRWMVPELVSNIKLRDAVRKLHETVGLQSLVCKW